VRPLRFIALLAILAVAGSAFALDVPPPPRQWFTDAAGIVTPDQAAALNEKLRNFEQQSGAQFIIYTFPALDGEALEDFTIRCAEKWKVGQKKYDNGVILFLFMKERKIRFEVGYGLEPTLTDAFTTRVRTEALAPRLAKGDYFGGLNAAADAIIAKVTKNEEPVAPLNPSGSQRGRATGKDEGFNPQLIIFLVFMFVVFVLPMLLGGRRRRGGCGGCIPLFLPFGGSGITFGGGGGGWGGGGGGFSGGGGGFGGGGSSGGW
jgi:uncharacterized protein